MIEIVVSHGEVIARGLIPGQVVKLTLDGERVLLIHRHGPSCHVHELERKEKR